MEIIFDNVSYSYNSDLPISNKVLKDISIKIKKNQINAIIGPSGSGKTTCIELITALMIPTHGSINVGETVINKKTN
jgi:energy-coupling factor transport system ATP-binding protein